MTLQGLLQLHGIPAAEAERRAAAYLAARRPARPAGPVLMRYTIEAKVLPAFVQTYLDDGWTLVEPPADRPASVLETTKTYALQLPQPERCSSCSGVINQQTGECRCSD